MLTKDTRTSDLKVINNVLKELLTKALVKRLMIVDDS